MGGLGLRSAERTALRAFLSSWADCLEMIRCRYPDVAGAIVASLNQDRLPEGTSLRELQDCRDIIHRTGKLQCHSWTELAHGMRPPQRLDPEPGEWAHGWKCYAAGAQDEAARDRFRSAAPGRRETKALARSQCGPCSGKVSRCYLLLHCSPSLLQSFASSCFR